MINKEELLKAAAPKLATIMFAMFKEKDVPGAEQKIFQLVKETFTEEEMIVVVCSKATDLLIEALKENPHLDSLGEILKSKQ